MMQFMEATTTSNSSTWRPNLWMMHNYVKQAQFDGTQERLRDYAWHMVVEGVLGVAGYSQHNTPLTQQADGFFHVLHCSSPEYFCYPPFSDLACKPSTDCAYVCVCHLS